MSLDTSKAPKSAPPQDEAGLEAAILAYQAALKTQDAAAITRAYNAVCALYQPLNFVQIWYKQYRYLYDTREDFVQEYLHIFCKALTFWKPREQRGESRYEGNGKFMNYFWGSLKHHYINAQKAVAAGKRNLSCLCPLCDTWCNTLSTHLLIHHSELMWEQMAVYGMPVETLSTCPFCKSYKPPRSVACHHQPKGACADCQRYASQEALRKHLLSLHSTHLFERFRSRYPNHLTFTPRPATVHLPGDEEEELNLYDMVSEENPVQQVLAYDLTPVQKRIIAHVFDGNHTVVYDAARFPCSEEEFEQELDGLRTIMVMCGLE